MGQLIVLSRGIDALTAWIGRAAAWAIIVAVLVSAINAIVRKLFGVSSNAWLELQWYLFGAVFMLCAPWTLAMNEHIRIDIVSSRMGRRTRNILEMIGHLVFLLPFALLLIYLSLPFFLQSFRTGEVSNSAGGLIIWPAKFLILAGFGLLLVQGVSEAIKRLGVMTGSIEDAHTAAGHQAAADAEAEAEAERLLNITASDPSGHNGAAAPAASRPIAES